MAGNYERRRVNMLILSRKVGERIVIAGDIIVKVLEVQGKRVRLGIDAPTGVNIRREELVPRSQEEELAHSSAGAENAAR
jgi:carbon storage regulator